MAHSDAFREFSKALNMAKALLELEKNNYNNPPRESERKAVFGLRGGAAILMVAAFERFTRAVLEEYLTPLTSQPPKVKFDKLPDQMRVCSVYNSLKNAMDGPRFVEGHNRIDRLGDIEQACKYIVVGTIDSSAFSNTAGNPGSKTVTLLWKQIGVQTVLDTIKPRFEKKWGQPVAHAFIAGKLDEIVNRRHVVAHTSMVSDIGRSQLKEAVKFLDILAETLDAATRNHLKNILKSP